MTDEAGDRPLLVQEPLAPRRAVRPLQTKKEWAYLTVSLLVSATPVIAGFYYAFMALSFAFMGDLAWWAAPLGATLFVMSVALPLLVVYAFTERKKYLPLTLILAVAAWPIVALMGFFLTRA